MRCRTSWTIGIIVSILLIPSTVLADDFRSDDIPSVYRCYGTALTPDSSTLFVISTSGVVLVHDLEGGGLSNVIDVRETLIRPSAGVVARGKLYVESFGEIGVIDADSHDLVATIEQPFYPGLSYGAVVASPSGNRVYAIGGSTTHVTVINTANDHVVGTVEVGGQNTGMDISADGRTLYVANAYQNRLTLIDTQSLSVEAEVPYAMSGGVSPYNSQVVVSPGTGEVFVSYVNDGFQGRIAVLTETGQFLRRFDVENFSTGLDIASDGRYLVMGAGWVLDPETGSTLGQISMSLPGLSSVTLAPDGMTAYVANINDSYVKRVRGFVPPLSVVDAVPAGGDDLLALELNLPTEAGRPYQVGVGLGTDLGVALPDGRSVPVNLDSLMQACLDPGRGDVFVRFAGTLDAQGMAHPRIRLGEDLPMEAIGQPLYLVFVTFENRRSRADVRAISNLISTTLTP